MDDADVFLYAVEIGETSGPEEILKKLNKTKAPVIVLINKIDKTDQQHV